MQVAGLLHVGHIDVDAAKDCPLDAPEEHLREYTSPSGLGPMRYLCSGTYFATAQPEDSSPPLTFKASMLV